MGNTFKILIVSTAIMIFTACGGGSSSENNEVTPPPSPLTGVFLDSAVAGLNYECSSGSTGTTNSSGEYTCRVGDIVTFSVGAYVIGSCRAAETVSPYTLYPNFNRAAINVAQLLQTIDSDDLPSNGIIIPNSFNALDGLATTPRDDTFEADVLALLGGALIDGTTAEIHLHATLGIPHQSVGFTADWIEGRTLYSAFLDSDDSYGGTGETDWLLIAEKYEAGRKYLDVFADGTFETDNAFSITNGELMITEDAGMVTKTMISINGVRITERMHTAWNDVNTTVYDFFTKTDAEAYIVTRSYPCACGYFTTTFMEGNTLYSVVPDTQNYDNDSTTEWLVVAEKYENGIRSLDLGADGTFEVTTDSFEIIDGALKITELGGDVIRQTIKSATKKEMLVTILVNDTPEGEGYVFYTQADAEVYMNSL